MAASNTVTDIKPYANGLIIEIGTFDLDTDTALTITASAGSTDYTAGQTGILQIYTTDFYSDGDNAIAKAKDVAPNQVKITGTQGDTGDYVLIGPAA
jgi:hypothetical protein